MQRYKKIIAYILSFLIIFQTFSPVISLGVTNTPINTAEEINLGTDLLKITDFKNDKKTTDSDTDFVTTSVNLSWLESDIEDVKLELKVKDNTGVAIVDDYSREENIGEYVDSIFFCNFEQRVEYKFGKINAGVTINLNIKTMASGFASKDDTYKINLKLTYRDKDGNLVEKEENSEEILVNYQTDGNFVDFEDPNPCKWIYTDKNMDSEGNINKEGYLGNRTENYFIFKNRGMQSFKDFELEYIFHDQTSKDKIKMTRDYISFGRTESTSSNIDKFYFKRTDDNSDPLKENYKTGYVNGNKYKMFYIYERLDIDETMAVGTTYGFDINLKEQGKIIASYSYTITRVAGEYEIKLENKIRDYEYIEDNSEFLYRNNFEMSGDSGGDNPMNNAKLEIEIPEGILTSKVLHGRTQSEGPRSFIESIDTYDRNNNKIDVNQKIEKEGVTGDITVFEKDEDLSKVVLNFKPLYTKVYRVPPSVIFKNIGIDEKTFKEAKFSYNTKNTSDEILGNKVVLKPKKDLGNGVLGHFRYCDETDEPNGRTFQMGDTIRYRNSIAINKGSMKNPVIFLKVPKGMEVENLNNYILSQIYSNMSYEYIPALAMYSNEKRNLEDAVKVSYDNRYDLYVYKADTELVPKIGPEYSFIKNELLFKNVISGDYELLFGMAFDDESDYKFDGSVGTTKVIESTEDLENLNKAIKEATGNENLNFSKYLQRKANIKVQETNNINTKIEYKKQGDDNWTNIGEDSSNLEIVPGGKVDFRISLENEGSSQLTELDLINILPHIGDKLGSGEDRGSMFPMTLIDNKPILKLNSSESNLLLETSNSYEPSRFLIPGGEDIDGENWISGEEDLSKIKSMKVSINEENQLYPGDKLSLEYTLEIPIDTERPEDETEQIISNNNIIYRYTRLKSGNIIKGASESEIAKVEIKKAEDNGILGGTAFIDINRNQIKDLEEIGLEDVKILLYRKGENGFEILDENGIKTQANGKFEFTDLKYGVYKIKIDLLDKKGFEILEDSIDDEGFLIDKNQGSEFIINDLKEGAEKIQNIEIPIKTETTLKGSLDFVKRDGTLVDTKDYSKGIIINLYREDEFISWARTDESGNYEFKEIDKKIDREMNLSMEIKLPENFEIYDKDDLNIDIKPSDELIKTLKFTDIKSPEINLNLEKNKENTNYKSAEIVILEKETKYKTIYKFKVDELDVEEFTVENQEKIDIKSKLNEIVNNGGKKILIEITVEDSGGNISKKDHLIEVKDINILEIEKDILYRTGDKLSIEKLKEDIIKTATINGIDAFGKVEIEFPNGKNIENLTETKGKYILKIKLGDIEKNCEVEIKKDLSEITLKDITIKINTTWDKKDNFVEALNEDGEKLELSEIKVEGIVDTSKIGDYEVEYSYRNIVETANIKVEDYNYKIESDIEEKDYILGDEIKDSTILKDFGIKAFRDGEDYPLGNKDKFIIKPSLDSIVDEGEKEIEIFLVVDNREVAKIKVNLNIFKDEKSIEVVDKIIYIGDNWNKDMNFIKATDERGNELSIEDIKVEGDVDTSTVGEYIIHYSYKDLVKEAKVIVKEVYELELTDKEISYYKNEKIDIKDLKNQIVEKALEKDIDSMEKVNIEFPDGLNIENLTFEEGEVQLKFILGDKTKTFTISIKSIKSGIILKEKTIELFTGETWNPRDNIEKVIDKDGIEVDKSKVSIEEIPKLDLNTIGEYRIIYRFNEVVKIEKIEEENIVTEDNINLENDTETKENLEESNLNSLKTRENTDEDTEENIFETKIEALVIVRAAYELEVKDIEYIKNEELNMERLLDDTITKANIKGVESRGKVEIEFPEEKNIENLTAKKGKYKLIAKLGDIEKEIIVNIKGKDGGGEITPPTKPEETVNIDYLILANGDKYTDVLTSTVLGNQLKAPILLTKTNYMDEDTKAEIERLNPKNIIISGGEGSVSEKLVKDLKDSGINIERLSGIDRYGTAREIAKKVRSITGIKDKITLVDGTNFPDVITISTYSSIKHAPILLTEPESLNNVTKKALSDFNISNITIGGGDASVSKTIEKFLKADYKVERIGGYDRYETASLIAKEVRKLTGNKEDLILVDGTNFPDGITINSLAGKYNSPIHLTNPNTLEDITKKDIKDFNIKNILIGGGTNSVSENTENYLKGENINTERISGKDRYKTAVKISEKFTEK